MDIIDKIDIFLIKEAVVSKYKKRNVYHGKIKSKSGRKKGIDKRKYVKSLKQRKLKYKRDASYRKKISFNQKKYRRTAKYKLAKRLYKGKK